jgi:hypothetical protein
MAVWNRCVRLGNSSTKNRNGYTGNRIPVNYYPLRLRLLKKNMSTGYPSRSDIKRTWFTFLGMMSERSLLTYRLVSLDPPSQLEVVTCHLCVLNKHRLHQRTCPESTPAHPRCSCRPDLVYELYPRYDVEAFLAHMKGRHLEYFERFRDILAKMSVQRRAAYEVDKDVWEVQRLIREVYGMGDDLM